MFGDFSKSGFSYEGKSKGLVWDDEEGIVMCFNFGQCGRSYLNVVYLCGIGACGKGQAFDPFLGWSWDRDVFVVCLES